MGKHLVTNFLASLTSLAIPIVLYGLIAATTVPIRMVLLMTR